jgi:hypothetical protein
MPGNIFCRMNESAVKLRHFQTHVDMSCNETHTQGAELSKTKVMSSLEESPPSGTSRSVFFLRFARLRMVAVFVSSCAGCWGGPNGGPGRPLCCGP